MEITTPFRTTIFYNPESAFESAVAYLTDRAQRVSVYSGASRCPQLNLQPSPAAILFGEVSSEILSECAGIKRILICSDASSKKSDEKNTTDSAIIFFTINEFFNIPSDYWQPRGGMSVQIIDLAALATFPHYVSKMNADRKMGKNFMRAITGTQVGFQESLEAARKMTMLDGISGIIARGQGIKNCRCQMARSRLANAVKYELDLTELTDSTVPPITIAAICGEDLHKELIKAANQNNCATLLYEFEQHVDAGIAYPGWRVTMIGPYSEKILDIFGTKTVSLSADKPVFTSWVPTFLAARLLPFIYLGSKPQ